MTAITPERLQKLRRVLHKLGRRTSDTPAVAKRYAEQMIAQIDSRRSPFPFVEQIERTEKRFAHRIAGGLFPDHSAEHIAQALGLQNNDDRGGFEALSEDGRLFDVYPNAIVTEGQSAEVNSGSPDQS